MLMRKLCPLSAKLGYLTPSGLGFGASASLQLSEGAFIARVAEMFKKILKNLSTQGSFPEIYLVSCQAIIKFSKTELNFVIAHCTSKKNLKLIFKSITEIPGSAY